MNLDGEVVTARGCLGMLVALAVSVPLWALTVWLVVR